MDKLKIGDKVRLAGYDKQGNEVILWEGFVISFINVGDSQFCTVEIAEGSGIWANIKTGTVFSDSLEKIEV